MTDRPFLILIVLDGFGCRRDAEWNAIAQADKPRFDDLFRRSSWTTLDASGLAVGLPPGQMGNSEVGHLNIGAGRVVDQDIVRISKAVDRGDLAKAPILVETFDSLKKSGRAIHFAGLLSDGGVHSLQHHLHGLIDAALANGMTLRDGAPSVFVHAILDGRDTPPVSAKKYVQQLLDFIADKPQVRLATIAGRYYTMDRDKRWERVQRGYDLMTLGVGTETKHPLATMDRFYEQGINDEFMEPISLLDPSGAHFGRIEERDALLFFNFRADRMRQIVTAFKDDGFAGFDRALHPRVSLVTMNQYREDFGLPVVFPPQEIRNNLGEVLARAGLRQLRIAETEKYAHVTFFFNGGSDTTFPGEDRILVPSPKIATYDLKPEMSVIELTDRVVKAIDAHKYDVIILNIANPDMVGHTGVMAAAIEAVHATDTAVNRILDAVTCAGGVALVTADHGNCELMFDPATNQPHTAHTTNPVPLILFDPRSHFALQKKRGALENVAPTILEILGLEKPAEMTAPSLLDHENAAVGVASAAARETAS
ncbi:MAG TPA: 2,3-bisphosphoglycerate-independent phosphoglycerate mutase [Thermoanaerobaculia bacterium]|nr:2,3-bisphosphoglycerate-independent phosphoglycerate mutase [Thermoanaerobaculia bacterium]